jgi:succinate dehydrogenase / fumarate reductase membrane anchor subunit
MERAMTGGEKNQTRLHLLLWLTQRISAVILLVLVPAHMWLLRYSRPHEDPQLADVASRLAQTGFVLFDAALLAFALFHALNGIRSILRDHGTEKIAGLRVSCILLLAGLLFVAIGLTPLAVLWLAG